MSCGNGGVCEVDVTFPFKDKRLRAVAASVLIRRHSNGPMDKWNGMDFQERDFVGKPYGTSATSLHLLLMQLQ